MNDLIKTVDGGLENKEYIFTPYKENEKKEFCIINIWPGLLYPEVKNKYTIDKEKYTIGRESLNKGQIKFEIYAGSREELHNIFVYFSKKGYRHIKICFDGYRNGVTEKSYTLEKLYSSNYYYSPNILGCENIMTITICTKYLEKFKKDIKNLRKEYGYRTSWEGEKLYSYDNKKIID